MKIEDDFVFIFPVKSRQQDKSLDKENGCWNGVKFTSVLVMQALRNLFGSHNESEVMEITSKAQLQSALKMVSEVVQYVLVIQSQNDLEFRPIKVLI